MVRSVSGPAKRLTWMALGVALGCDGGGSARPAATTTAAPPTVSALSERDLDAYATGTRAEIEVLRHAMQSGRAVEVRACDSVAAQAARVSVEQFRAIRTAVETSLKTQSVVASRATRLDSLRIELMLLRVRADAQP